MLEGGYERLYKSETYKDWSEKGSSNFEVGCDSASPGCSQVAFISLSLGFLILGKPRLSSFGDEKADTG